jgi:hypothetical protein
MIAKVLNPGFAAQMRRDSTGELRRKYVAGATSLFDSLARGAIVDLLAGDDGEYAADLHAFAHRRVAKCFASDEIPRAAEAAAVALLLGCGRDFVAGERAERAYQAEATAAFMSEMESEGLQHLPPADREDGRRVAS